MNPHPLYTRCLLIAKKSRRLKYSGRPEHIQGRRPTWAPTFKPGTFQRGEAAQRDSHALSFTEERTRQQARRVDEMCGRRPVPLAGVPYKGYLLWGLLSTYLRILANFVSPPPPA
jgi:hypothetical protein